MKDLSTRDFFALELAKVLVEKEWDYDDEGGIFTFESLSRIAYRYADAMIETSRGKVNPFLKSGRSPVDEMEEYAEHVGKDKNKAKEFLSKTGVYTKDGKLTKEYGGG
jgi:hypothetical protein